MDNFIGQIQNIVVLIQANLPFTLSLIGLLWGIHIVNWLFRYRLNILGIYPRHLLGIPGIFCSPFLHGNFNHLILNSIPLFVLINLVLLQGVPVFYTVSLTIIVLSGACVWLLGRHALHIGASSLIMGYFGYLLANAYFQITPVTILLAIICAYYFGGMIVSSLFPTKANVSIEGHLFGFLAGIATAYLLPVLLTP